MQGRDLLSSGANGVATFAPPVRSRRGFLQMVGGAVVAGLTGCSALKPKCELAQNLPMPDIVAHLNNNIDQIDAWNCNHVSVSAKGPQMRMPSVAAKMTVERPRNFRLTADVFGRDVVDLGSNDKRFWFWTKDENTTYTARHDQMAAAQQQLPLPFEPDWLIEALGVIPLNPDEIEFEKHKTEPKRVMLVRQRTAPDGAPVELVSTVDTCLGVIVEHSLVDRRGNIIALAKMGKHQRWGDKRLVLPTEVALSWPQAQLGLGLTMGAIIVNPPSIPKQIFAMPKRDCQIVDIGAGDGNEADQVVHEAPEPRTRRGRARL